MKAIMLSYDKTLPFAHLAVEAYRDVWSDHPFQFLVSYNEKYPDWFDYEEVTPVESAPPIRESMEALLDRIDDDEFVYWAIDDRYPYSIKHMALNQILQIIELEPDWFDEVKLTAHHGSEIGKKYLELDGVSFGNQTGKKAKGFWMHHFIKAGLLRKQFTRNLPDKYPIHAVTEKLRQESYPERTWIPDTAVVLQAEPARRGAITYNAIGDMRKYGVEVPEYEIMTTRIIYQEDGTRK